MGEFCFKLQQCFKEYLYPKNIFWYVEGAQFRSPLHQYSVKNIHQVMKLYISKFRVWEETIKIVTKLVFTKVLSDPVIF